MTTTLEPYEFRDPAALMAELAERISLDENTAHLLLVDHPSTVQRIVRIERLTTPAEILSGEDAEEEMRDVIDAWPLPEVRPPRHSTMLVLVRPGLCVFGPNEAQWLLADRYLNHLRPLYTGDCLLVTEHGWVDWMTYLAGRTPAMRAAA
jgi:hypothetical protein